MIEQGFLGVKYAKSYDYLHEKYREQVKHQYETLEATEED